MKRILFFVNPRSGQGARGLDLMGILQTFSNGGYRIEIYPTKGPRDLTEVLAREGMHYDMIVASGGDGTLNEAVSGLMALPRESRPLLGYIPKGTVNDVSSNLGLSKEPLQAAKDIVSGVPFRMDVGSFNRKWFNYVAAFGAFTDVAYRTSQETKQVLGRLAYLLDGIKSLSEMKSIPVTMKVDGRIVQEEVLIGLVTSTVSVGGFRVMKEDMVDLSDGLFEVLLVKKLSSMQTLKQVIDALGRQDLSGDGFIFCKASQVEFSFQQPVDWTLDGEFGGREDRVLIRNHKRAVTVQVPKVEERSVRHLTDKNFD